MYRHCLLEPNVAPGVVEYTLLIQSYPV